MEIYPAIDLREGQCVRLYQGDFTQMTHYHAEPLFIAQDFAEKGAKCLHVVDLDAAKNPSLSQKNLIKRLVRDTQLSYQIGGGIRELEQLNDYFAAGAKRMVIGSIAVMQPQVVKHWLQEFGRERLVLALDVRYVDAELRVALHGWQDYASVDVLELLGQYYDWGILHVLCTDIACDGALTGPNFSLYQQLLTKFPGLQLQASGGIRNLADLEQLKDLGVAAAIVGRALYEEKIDLETIMKELAC